MKVIMNPPFRSTLHLKIFETALSYTNKVICLSPAKWLMKYMVNRPSGKYRERLNGKISAIKIFDKDETKSYFDIGNQVDDLGLYSTIGEPIDLTNYGFESPTEASLYKKINPFINKYFTTLEACSFFKKYKESAFIEGKVYVPIYAWHSGKTATESILRTTPKNCFLYFDTEEEAENFRKSLDTDFMNWWNKMIILPNDGKSICNNLTAKSYLQPINDDYFYKAFDLNEDEILLIKKQLNND